MQHENNGIFNASATTKSDETPALRNRTSRPATQPFKHRVVPDHFATENSSEPVRTDTDRRIRAWENAKETEKNHGPGKPP